MLSLMDSVIGERTELRRAIAVARVAEITSDLKREGVEVAMIGSLATGNFRAHSDIDLLVRTGVDSSWRARVERIVANRLRGTGIPYDLVFADDLTAERLREFEHDLVQTSSLC